MTIPINPFSSRYVRPGQIPFRLPPGLRLEDLVRRLAESGWRGELVGPHGSGKSTLVADLLRQVPRPAAQVTVRAADRLTDRLTEILRTINRLGGNGLLVIDGIEQFSRRRRKEIIEAAAATGCGLLVTTHQSVGLPTLLELRPDLGRFRELVDQLQSGQTIRLSTEEIDAAYARHQPNLREALFALYDVFEIRRRAGGQG